MTKSKNTPGFILKIGAALIMLSGIVSLIISIPNGNVYNGIDPFGIFGHIGIINGIAAMIIGGFLLWFCHLNYSTPLKTILAGILSIVFSHFGAIAGALLVGTAGLLLCYIAGIWFIVLGIKRLSNKSTQNQIKPILDNNSQSLL